MAEQEKTQREVIELWLAAMDSEATEDRAEELSRLIVDNPKAREQIIALSNQQAWLMWYGSQLGSAASGKDPNEEVLACIDTLIDKPDKNDLEQASNPLTAAGSCTGDNESHPNLAVNPLPDSASKETTPFTNALRTALNWSPVAALLFIGVLATAFWQSDSVPKQEATIIENGVGIDGFAQDSGTVRVKLRNVGYMDVEGMADLEMLSPKHARLNRGKIRVHVTEKAGHGFIVTTPHGEVTDLGTEFGLDVSDRNTTELVVFAGQVDLLRQGRSNLPIVTRLTDGEGARFRSKGKLKRVMSIVTGDGATFHGSHRSMDGDAPVILDVWDNLPADGTKRFYEIVRGGMGEDVPAYVDRTYEWNGWDASGMPEFLLGADYIKTFCSDKLRSFELTVKLGTPADLYLFWDDRVPETEWLQQRFTDTGLGLALDEMPSGDNRPNAVAGVGPGAEVDWPYSIWHRLVDTPGEVTFGSLEVTATNKGMYGIAAVPIDTADREEGRPTKSQ